MRAVFLGAALVSILIAGLIVYVLSRGTIDFLREIDLSQLVDTGWFPRRDGSTEAAYGSWGRI